MVDNVKLNSGDNKSAVAYQMALDLWQTTNQGKRPSLESKDEFLNLVQECVQSLMSGVRRSEK